MTAHLSDMPALQAEDDGFLLQLKWTAIDPHLSELKLDKCKTIDDCVEKIIKESEDCIDRGSSLPLYIPFRDDEGVIQGYRVRPVWSGAHVGIPLYGDMCPDQVRALIVGGTMGGVKPSRSFMQFSPAFRVALLVHHICQIVLIHPLAAEAFVLGRYSELPFNDEHYEDFGVPSTQLIQVEPNSGLRMEWSARSKHQLSGTHEAEAHINGWRVLIRGSQPKEVLLKNAWQEIRDSLDKPRKAPYTVNGKQVKAQGPGASGRLRKRSIDPDVELMYKWVKGLLATKKFPMRGSFKDWKKAVTIFAEEYPTLADRWSSNAMRKAYERCRRNESGA